MGRVDPHLVQGCEVSPDIDEEPFEELYSVQKAFIRRLLGVHKRSPIAPLHTETGLIPLKFRRMELVLRYMEYLSRRPVGTYALAAYRDAVLLARNGKQGWLMDVALVVRALGLDIQLDELCTITADAISTLQSRLRACLTYTLNNAIEGGHKTYLLRDRWEPQSHSRRRQETMCLRHYLHVQTTAHRRALTRVLIGCHLLAVERLAWTERYRREVPHNERLCRFCKHSVETPEHAMLRCTSSQELVEARTEYLSKIYHERPDLPIASTVADTAKYLQMLVCDVPTIDLTAGFAHRVLKIYGKAPMYIPPEYFIRL